MATRITRNKSGKIISRKHIPGTKRSSRSSSSSSSKTRKATDEERKLAEAIAKAFAPKLKEISSKAKSRRRGSSRQTAAENSRFTAKIVDPRTGKVTQSIDKTIRKRGSGSGSARQIEQARQEQTRRLEEAQRKVLTPTLKPVVVTSKPFVQLDSTTQRLLRGESITSLQRQQLRQSLNKNKTSIERQQLDLAVKGLASPVTYGKNLRKRFEKGENNPLFNDVANFSKGLKAGAVDPIVDLVKLAWQGSKFSVKSAYSYGRRIQSEAQKGNFVIDDDVVKVAKTIGRGAKTTVQIAKVAKDFVAKDPVAAALIVSMSTAQFIGSSGKKITKLTADAYTKNPANFLGQVIGFAVGQQLLIGAVSKGVKATPITRLILEEKFIRGNPKKLQPFVRAIIKGAKAQEKLSPAKIKSLKKINFNQVVELNKVEAQAVKKALQNTDSFVFGSLPSRVISKGRTPLPKDVDLATRNVKMFYDSFLNNIPKKSRNLYKIKGEKLVKVQGKTKTALLDVKGYDRLRPDQSIFGGSKLPIYENVAKKGNHISLRQASLTAPTQKLVKIEGVQLVGFGEQTTRKGLGTLQVLIEKNARRAKDPAAFIQSLEIQLKALKQSTKGAKGFKKVLNIPKNLKAKQLQDSIKILKSKKFAKLLDSKVKGLTKEYPILQKNLGSGKLSKVLSKKKTKFIKPKTKIKVKGKKPSKIKSKKTVKAKVKTKIKKPSKLPSKLPTSKIPKSKIPSKLRSRIPKSRIPKSKIPSKLPSKVPSRLKTTSRLSPKTSITPSKVPTPSKTPISGVSKVPSASPSKVPGPAGSKVPGAPPKKPPVTPKKPPVIQLLSFDSSLPKGKRLAFDVLVKEKGKVKRIKLGLPENKALQRLGKGVDNSLTRSAELVIAGVTSKKDITRPKRILTKFRLKKTKNTLELVEKTKHAIDTRGEKKGLKLSKLLKPKKKKTIKAKKKRK